MLIIVNTASECAFTSQYQEMQKLYNIYKKQKLEIIAIPTNDFGGQEPGNIKHIIEFTKKFNRTFHIVDKVSTDKKTGHEFFTWVRENGGTMAAPKWNFYKYLIDSNGKFVNYYVSTTNPTSPKITSAIEDLLKSK